MGIDKIKSNFSTDITQTNKYKQDEAQLKTDREYFESLFTQAKNGDKSAIEEINSLQVQSTVKVNNSNDRLLNENSAFLLQIKNSIGKVSEKNSNSNGNLNKEQNDKKDLIMEQLRQNPENDDITDADVQQYILQEQL